MTTPPIETVFQQIREIMQWYYDTSASDTDIADLINQKDRLAVLSFYLAEESAKAKRIYNRSYYIRKIEVSKAKHGMMASKRTRTLGEAEALSTSENAELFSKEMEHEAMSYMLDTLLRQINHILMAMRDRFTWLKSEWEQQKAMANMR